MKTILIPIWEEKQQYHLNVAYIRYIRMAGYQPVMVGYDSNVEKLADMMDGLLLSGGGDIDPIYYGADNVASYWPDPKRDEIERCLYWAFVERNKPIFGICRGFQLIFLEEWRMAKMKCIMDENAEVPDGLEYKQHVSGHSQTDRVFRWLESHRILHTPRLYDLTATSETLGTSRYVNSMHHQAVKWPTFLDKKNKSKRFLVDVTGPIVPLAYAPAAAKEPIIMEAFTVKDRNVLAVQWHPEELDDVRLLWNIFGEPTGANKAMKDYAKEMESRTKAAEESNELETN
jgi:putative glutamine amidotransferase